MALRLLAPNVSAAPTHTAVLVIRTLHTSAALLGEPRLSWRQTEMSGEVLVVTAGWWDPWPPVTEAGRLLSDKAPEPRPSAPSSCARRGPAGTGLGAWEEGGATSQEAGARVAELARGTGVTMGSEEVGGGDQELEVEHPVSVPHGGRGSQPSTS